jgi:OOP family OmpA-OmpF porin
VDLRGLSFSGVGNQDVRRYAWGFAPSLLGTYDFREPWPKLPLIAHANVGFAFDSTGNLAQGHDLNAAEDFALDADSYNRFAFGVGVEAPLPVATPFLEYNVGVPLCASGLVGPDGVGVAVGAVMPQTFTFGAKLTAIRDLTLLLAFDVGLARSVALGIPATMPFQTFVAASFTVDPFMRGNAKIIETVREKKVDKPVAEAVKTGKVTGVITDAQTHKPISGVIVAMVGAGLPPVATDPDAGRFLTHELPQGPVKLQLQKDGYKDALQELTIEAGKTENLDVQLDPLARNAHFLVTVASGKKAVAAAVSLKGPAEQQANTLDGATEPLKVEAPAGQYVVNVTATGYLAQTREVQVSENGEMKLAFDLAPEPKKRLVVVKENKIEILQQVHFATAKATILADSFSLLNQVVDAIVTHGIKRVRVEGHTDNRGAKPTNAKLSEDRAKSVADYLAHAGIDPSRIESIGYGDTRPVAPNLTARGRELNRRVEFVILDH